MFRLLLLTGLVAWSAPMLACSCFGTATFCEATDTSWVEPDLVVLGVKLDELHYGMHVKVVQVLQGDAEAGDTLMVWGDNGALCRVYVGAWANGDTVLWGLHESDLSGNFIWNQQYPPDLEMVGDYHISVCGVYWLNYGNGQVTGSIADGLNSLPLAALPAYLQGCPSTSVGEEELPELTIRVEGGRLVVSLPGHGTLDRAELWSLDGRLLQRSGIPAPTQVLPLEQAAGCYLVRAWSGTRGLAQRVVTAR